MHCVMPCSASSLKQVIPCFAMCAEKYASSSSVSSPEIKSSSNSHHMTSHGEELSDEFRMNTQISSLYHSNFRSESVSVWKGVNTRPKQKTAKKGFYVCLFACLFFGAVLTTLFCFVLYSSSLLGVVSWLWIRQEQEQTSQKQAQTRLSHVNSCGSSSTEWWRLRACSSRITASYRVSL